MDSLGIYYQNCNGLRTKISEFYGNLIGCDYGLVCLTETFLNDSFNSYSYFSSNYYVYRKDRSTPGADQDRRGGGVLIGSKKNLKVKRRFDLDFNHIECVWLEVELRPDCTLLLGNHYFPPDINVSIVQQYCDFLRDSIDISKYKVLLVGDYNLPKFNWEMGYSCHDNSYIKHKSELIYSLFCDLALKQQNFERINPCDNILDLVVSNFNDELSISQEPELVTLDRRHPSLLIQLTLPVFNHNYVPLVKKNFKNGDYLGLYNYLSDYNYADSPDPDVLSQDLNNAVSNAIGTFIPDKAIIPSKYPHWFSYKLRKFLSLKEKFHKKVKKYPSNTYFRESFKKFRKLSKKQLTFDDRQFKCKVESDLHHNPKFFWQFIKSQYKNPHEISIVQNGQVITEDRVPYVFAEHFGSVYNATHIVPQAQQSSNVDVPLLVPPVISVADVIKATKGLKSSFVTGHDNFPAFILKGCIVVLAPVLCRLFNACLLEGKFPALWKISIVVPVPKNSSVSNVQNYRPISLLPNFSKVFEKIIVNHISFHVSTLLSSHQHGFLKGRSTTSNLVSFLQYAAPSVLNQKQLDTVYFDLSRAFDVVSHDLLLHKLCNFGLTPSYVKIFRSYLENRTFRVKSGNFFSSDHAIPSGVPQGSNLGPLLFVLFIDDIKHVISSRYELFADDLKISRVIYDADDAQNLQKDIDSIIKWCSENGMKCNSDKTVVLSFTRKKKTYFHNYKISDTVIVRKYEHRDLGIFFDSKLYFHCQLQKVLATGKKSSGLVYWVSKNFKNRSTVMVLFSALVRSRLEYCSEVWNGLGITDTARLEQIQKNFLRRVSYYDSGRSASYNVSLELYNLSKLSQRRTSKDIIFLYKVINHKIDCMYLVSNICLNIPRLNSRHIRHFKIPASDNRNLIPMNRFMYVSNLFPTLDFATSLYTFVEQVKDLLLQET